MKKLIQNQNKLGGVKSTSIYENNSEWHKDSVMIISNSKGLLEHDICACVKQLRLYLLNML